MSNLERVNVETGITEFTSQFERYLAELKLPEKNVLVDESERLVVIQNIPHAIQRLVDDQRMEAMYISKFIAACGAGLFDAALNFLWNEIIVNLRRKVAHFDMNYFIDSIITDTKRKKSFKDEEDLINLDDWELVRGCKDTGIITEIGYKHLDYIRDMRNHTSAAHPNHNDIDGLQLVGWLQTCIREVFAKDPEGAVIEVKRLLSNLRNYDVDEDDIPSIERNIELMPEDIVDSCLRAVFGMYTDPSTEVRVRNNLKLIVNILWNNCSEEEKNNVGIKYAVFSGNAEIERKTYATEFLDFVSGKSYLPEGEREVEMVRAIQDLYDVHNGYNNFYNEAPFARVLTSFVGDDGKIPMNINYKYVKVIIMCFIGNGHGIANAAVPHYDELIKKFTDPQIKVFLKLFNDSGFNSRLQFSGCANRVRSLAEDFLLKTANERYKTLLTKITDSTNKQLKNIQNETQFKSKLSKIKD
ncbi:hypothetical protein CSV80_00770 [Sporosarcina sp. P12(2017)]|uniref:hypothetical protein n=1 Tax=unclassified Sporosarcina TaxID=2647733 RepID=UPI000C16943F|nr:MULTISPECIES: hypothetical protein [unclassified Sporosarcina]PIC59088.1 hypothetical protein CSV81_00770 [Sporosarcina sp. P10]PIC62409.1 hypothetical protein CSV80_00770 [Sporosarcina sp. P12(2017)]